LGKLRKQQQLPWLAEADDAFIYGMAMFKPDPQGNVLSLEQAMYVFIHLNKNLAIKQK
jgi:hypothetical protein